MNWYSLIQELLHYRYRWVKWTCCLSWLQTEPRESLQSWRLHISERREETAKQPVTSSSYPHYPHPPQHCSAAAAAAVVAGCTWAIYRWERSADSEMMPMFGRRHFRLMVVGLQRGARCRPPTRPRHQHYHPRLNSASETERPATHSSKIVFNSTEYSHVNKFLMHWQKVVKSRLLS